MRTEANMQTTTPDPEPAADPVVIALRASLIGDRVTIEQTAAATNRTPRCIYQAVAKHNIPFVRILGVRYFSPADLRRALAPASDATGKRGRGRPRKVAA
jgi:hypothetical protein